MRCASRWLATVSLAVGLAAPGAGAAAGPGHPPGRPGAADGPSCSTSTGSGPVQPVTGTNAPYQALRLDEAQQLARGSGHPPGSGVTVAVVDTGVAARRVPVARVAPLGGPGAPTDPHGTTVAGLVAGAPIRPGGLAVGAAPDADLWDLPVARSADQVDAARVERGLAWLRDLPARPPRTVVVVAAAVARTPSLDRVLDDLIADGVLVVAAAGDRPGSGGDPVLGGYADGPTPGEDAADVVWPAGHEDVLAAGIATAADDAEPADRVALRNSAVDLAVPGRGGASYGLSGGCVLAEDSTEWAAATLGGIAALTWSARPELTAEQVRDRLTGTADGNGTADSPLVGYGDVQPVAALTRALDTPRTEGGHDVERAEVRDPRPDRLADTRRELLAWAAGGLGLVLVALLVRPLTRRRRS